MVERVARAIIPAINECGYSGDDGNGACANLRFFAIDCEVDLLAVARAAIAAMREPTDQMAKTGNEMLVQYEAAWVEALDIWHTMVGEALKS